MYNLKKAIIKRRNVSKLRQTADVTSGLGKCHDESLKFCGMDCRG